MNPIEKLLGRLGSDEREEALSAEDIAAEKQRRRTIGFARSQHLVGMGRVKFPSQGQLRRAQHRATLARGRKATKAHHRRWFRNESAVAALRGQIDVMDRPDLFQPGIVDEVARILTERYGSVDAARERNAELQAERAARREAMSR